MEVQNSSYSPAPTAKAMSNAMGIAPQQSSLNLGWTKVAMFAWRGEADDILYDTKEDPVIGFHTGGADNVLFETNGVLSYKPSRPGFITVMPSNAKMVWHVDGDVHAYSIHLLGDFFLGFRRDLLKSLIDALANYTAKSDPFMVPALNALANELSFPTEFGDYYADSLIDAIACHILKVSQIRYSEPNDRPLEPRVLKDVLSRIEYDLASGISVQNLARDLGYSRGEFANRFRKSVGIAPHSYISQQRISRAYALLSDPKKELCEIAIDCGYANQAHFTSQFKRMTGHTPGQIRRILSL